MLKSLVLASAASLLLAGAAGAQQQPAPSPAPARPAPTTAAPRISTVNVVDMQQLPAETQTKVNDFVAKQGKDDIKRLRASVDSTPEAKSALQAKGLSSEEVIAASLSNDGTLTLITRKKAG
jgi:hypothetical protein